MTRETKIGLLVGLGIILLIGIIVSDHLSVSRQGEPADLTGLASESQTTTSGSASDAAPRSVGSEPLIPGLADGDRSGSALGAPPSRDALISPELLAQRIAPIDRTAGSVTAPTGPGTVSGTGLDPVQTSELQRRVGVLQTPGELDRATQLAQANQTHHGQITQSADPLGQRNDSIFAQDGSFQGQNPDTAGDALRQQGLVALGLDHPNQSGTTGPDHLGGSTAPASGSVHYVKAGESLWTIAQKYYGDGSKYRLIADANKDKLLPSGGVREGVRLVIPPKPVVSNVTTPGSTPGITPGITPGSNPGSNPGQLDLQPRRATSGRVVTVQAGDTLGHLAARHLGSARHWQKLLAANQDQLDRPEDLQVGMTLRLPDVTSDVGRGTTIPDRAAVSATARAYTVKAGDTLISIARAQLRDESRWNDIFRANRSSLDSPHSLKVGQKLTLPEPRTASRD